MKNQNDLIVAGAVVLVCIGVSLGFMMTMRKPPVPPAPAPINVADAKPPEVGIVMTNALPGAAGANAGSGRRAGIRR